MLLSLSVFTLSSCLAKSVEKEINVVFMCDDEMIDSGTVTQFLNYKSPVLNDSYIPDNYKFYGWTPLKLSKVKATDENFKEEYIGAGKMVHYSDVAEYVSNSTVILRALMINKDDIPHEYHYAVIAWYDKVETTAITSAMIDNFSSKLKTYLSGQGVSDEDIDTIIIRGYTGNVGTSCGNIMNDEDVDIMLGWSSVNNVTTTGGIPEAMLLESILDLKVGVEHTRCIHRLSDSDTVKVVFDWMKTDDFRSIFA